MSAAWIFFDCRGVLAVCKDISAEQSSEIGSDAPVRVNESADGGIVIAALEVVEACFGVEVVAPVADGVGGCEGAFGCQNVAPGVVGVSGEETVPSAEITRSTSPCWFFTRMHSVSASAVL